MRQRYTRRNWYISRLANDFELLDVWAIPVSGEANELPRLRRLVLGMLTGSPTNKRSLSALLYSIRENVGSWFNLDNALNSLQIPGCQETSLRQRMKQENCQPKVEVSTQLPFRVIYEQENEFALEISNQLLHAVMHVGWYPTKDGKYAAELGVWVKYRSKWGRLYVAAIAPGRHWVVYPSMMRRLAAGWYADSTRDPSD